MLKEGTKAVVCLSLFSSFGIRVLQYKGTLRRKVLLFLATMAVSEQKATEVNDLAQITLGTAKYTYLNILTFLFFPLGFCPVTKWEMLEIPLEMGLWLFKYSNFTITRHTILTKM